MISENNKLPQNRNDNVIESCMEQIKAFDSKIEDLCKEEKELWNQLYEMLMNNTESNESGEVALPSESHNKYSEYRAKVVTPNTIGIDESPNKDNNENDRSKSEISEK